MREAVGVLRERRDAEGRGATAGRVDRHRDVTYVSLRLAHIVKNRGRHAFDHRLNVHGRKGLFRAVGADTQRFAQTANGERGGGRLARLGEGGKRGRRRCAQHRRILTPRAHAQGGELLVCVCAGGWRTSASNARTVSTFFELSQRGMLASLCRHRSGSAITGTSVSACQRGSMRGWKCAALTVGF